MIKILSLSGNKGAGKDEICKQLTKDFKNVIRLAFADDLKEEVSKEFGIELSELHKSEEYKNTTLTHVTWVDLHYDYGCHFFGKDDSPDCLTIRELLQIYGTEIKRDLDENYWIDKMEAKIEKIEAQRELAIADTLIVVTDTRFFNELRMLDNFDSATSIWLNRKSTGSSDGHISEQDLSELCDHQVDARGLAQFSYTYSEIVDIIDCELNIQRIKE